MIKKVLIFISLAFLCQGCGANQSMQSPEKGDLLDREIADFAKKIYSEYGFFLFGYGGSTYPDDKIKRFKISFESRQDTPFSLEESRIIIVDLISQFLDQVNSNEKIRPHLNNYPFDVRQVTISIVVCDLKGYRFHEPNIAFINYFDQKIFYDTHREGKGYIDNEKETIQDAVAILKEQGHSVSPYLEDLPPFSGKWVVWPPPQEEEVGKGE